MIMSIHQRAVKMKFTLCLLFFGACIALSHGQDIPSSPPSLVANMHENLRLLKRVARQAMPPPPEMPQNPENIPPPPNSYTILRKKREARGIGSLPTRKG